MYQAVLHKVHVHPPTPDKDKDKDMDKEEDDEDDQTLLVNSANLYIGRVTEMGSLGVGN